jgi:hypothetical protein
VPLDLKKYFHWACSGWYNAPSPGGVFAARGGTVRESGGGRNGDRSELLDVELGNTGAPNARDATGAIRRLRLRGFIARAGAIGARPRLTIRATAKTAGSNPIERRWRPDLPQLPPNLNCEKRTQIRKNARKYSPGLHVHHFHGARYEVPPTWARIVPRGRSAEAGFAHRLRFHARRCETNPTMPPGREK